MRDSLPAVEEDAIELVAARTRISRQAGLTLAMLVLIPTAAVLTAASWLLQSMANSSNPRGVVLLLAGIGMLLVDAAVVGGAILLWLTRRGGGRVTLADERGVTVRAGGRTAFVPWPEFIRVSLSGGTLLGWLRADSLFAAHPAVVRMPRRNADGQGNVPLVLGTLVEIPEALRRLKSWLGREVEIDLV
jgi:Bacterial PH domain